MGAGLVERPLLAFVFENIEIDFEMYEILTVKVYIWFTQPLTEMSTRSIKNNNLSGE
jgi:hypothetical protein